ncbi:MAG TPA: alpha/beta family hydrolase [Acidimicrobiales bacterium]|nr:alpha/beta family hydrolase [Acidimicrobiales bacterium]
MTKPKALLLTPGASATRNQPALVAIDDALTPRGIVVERMDFPNPRAKAPVLIQAVRDGAAALAKRAKVRPTSVALGGRSMGGRMCSMAVAEGLPAAALVLISYPLHPPGKPDQLRIQHFPAIEVPCLFISGTRDAFGSPDELEKATKAIKGAVTHIWIDGGDHGLRNKDKQVVEAVGSWLLLSSPK